MIIRDFIYDIIIQTYAELARLFQILEYEMCDK